ncbi:MAG: ribonucleoside-diphosphate reductase subunit alpha [Verrucomicrobiota bacterium]
MSETIVTQVIRRNTNQTDPNKPRIVPWIGHKIESAVANACLAVGVEDAANVGIRVRETIEQRIRAERPLFLHIEQLQDMVEENLMDAGQARVALAYGKYRARRAALRDLEIEEETKADAAPGTTAGQLELVDLATLNDVRARVEFASIGLSLSLSKHQLISKLVNSLGADLTNDEKEETLILNAKSMMDLDADMRYFAGRILLSYIYERTLPWKITDGPEKLKEAHRKAFIAYIPKAIELKRLDPRLQEYDIERLASSIDPFADLQFDFLGLQNLYDRYLIFHRESNTSSKKTYLEAPQMFWMRVSMGLSMLENDRTYWSTEFYNIYKNRLACSSTPTLFNAGTLHPQLSSCYLLYAGDSMEDIAETWTRFSMLSKWAGGLGCSWSAVRGSGARIHGTNGESNGIIPFLKVSNDIALAVNQGGKRPGALCSYLEPWHTDIEDFLDLRKETGDERRRTHNMNTALWIPDLFFKRIEEVSNGTLSKEATWTLFRSNEAPDLHDLYGAAFEQRYTEYEKLVDEGKMSGKKIRILALWKKMIEAIFETGHPWMTFKDPCNVRNPQDHVGVIHSSNLCTEITLNTSMEETAVCNLASINIATHLKEDGSIDHEKIKKTTKIVMRMLDNVIDINFYPTVSAKTSNTRHRPVGMGVMGMQDALFMKRVAFDSVEAVDFNDEIMEAICYYAYSASSDLAAERGAYSSFQGSKWQRGIMPLDSLELLEKNRGVTIEVNRSAKLDWNDLRNKIQSQGMRNSNCIAIAPTATISNIMGFNPCIEPIYKNIHTKSNLSGDFVRTNDYLIKDLQKLGLWDQEMLDDLKYFDGSVQNILRVPEELKNLYKTAFEIDSTWILQCAAVRQKWIDQAQSTNIWIGDNDARKVSNTYRESWRRGLKTTYYLRTLNKASIDSAHRDRAKKGEDVPSSPMAMANAMTPPAQRRAYSEEEKVACSIEAMRNGGTCEACQ